MLNMLSQTNTESDSVIFNNSFTPLCFEPTNKDQRKITIKAK